MAANRQSSKSLQHSVAWNLRTLEHRVLQSARALNGALKRRGFFGVSDVTWNRFFSATDALHKFHANRMRRKHAR